MNNLKFKNNIYSAIPVILRAVMGWIYFSAFWRRVILMNKLDPNIAGYVGEKFNAFLPNALFIKPIIQWLVDNPDMLWINMIVFTLVEALIGLSFFLGLFVRPMALVSVGVASGILLGSGWLGTTCLDEWQIGVLCIMAGTLLFFTGSGDYSLDKKIENRKITCFEKPKYRWLIVQDLETLVSPTKLRKTILASAILIFLIMTGTNQHFHGGVWGPLHNLSKKPNYEVTELQMKSNKVRFDIMRTEGIDTYGSFLFKVSLLNSNVEKQSWKDEVLSNKVEITNHHVAMIKSGAHGLELPLGAKATITLSTNAIDADTLMIEDISGKRWFFKIKN
ncbi:quinol oxidase [Halosquirtibacter laminarini]|uniref:Quinol oxidase n=1 Tax=Halosquirtibacter laminarini TaxID=3374600 RepID=A0AC61NJ41_9BACT|nr:quinol oxidase [Prolixibacteraceae bacterium]